MNLRTKSWIIFFIDSLNFTGLLLHCVLRSLTTICHGLSVIDKQRKRKKNSFTGIQIWWWVSLIYMHYSDKLNGKTIRVMLTMYQYILPYYIYRILHAKICITCNINPKPLYHPKGYQPEGWYTCRSTVDTKHVILIFACHVHYTIYLILIL